MMKPNWKTAAVLILLTAMGAILIASCKGSDPQEMGLDAILREGRRSLEAGDAGAAYNLFLQARRMSPSHPDALWGTVLANDLLVWRNLSGMVRLLGGPYIYQPSREECYEGCQKIERCDLFDELRTSKDTCIADCPWKLQPFMFDEVLSAPTCFDLRYGAADWIVQTTPVNCRRLCESVDRCGLVRPPETYTVDECIENCPTMYVERHSQCYLNAGEFGCHRFDRTCFEHTVLGIQLIINEFGLKRTPETLFFSQQLLDRPDDYQYYLRHYSWDMVKPEFEFSFWGRFAHAELYLSRALANAWSAFVHLTSAQNLDLNTVTFDQFTWNGSVCKIVLGDAEHVLRNLLKDPIFPNAFRLKDDGLALKNMRASGQNMGHMFGEFAAMTRALLGSTDRQDGRALGYSDSNRNLTWDEDEVWSLPDLDMELTKAETLALQELFEDLEASFLYATPVPLKSFKVIFSILDAQAYSIILDLIPILMDRTTVNPGYAFLYPSTEGIRPGVEQIVEFLGKLKSQAADLPAFLECDEIL